MESEHCGRWPKDIENYFIDRCIEGTNLNKRIGRGWGKDGYNWLVNEMQKIGFRTSAKVVKQKWEHMKKVFRNWDDLLRKFTGLGVNPQTGEIDAPDSFWEIACKDNPDMKRLKNKAIDTGLFAKYHMLFAGLSATGLRAWAPTDGVTSFSHQDMQHAYRPSPPREGSGDSEDSQFGIDLNSPEPSVRHMSPTGGTNGSGHKRSRDEEVTSPKKSVRSNTRDGSRVSRRNIQTTLSDSINNMTTRLCSAMESRNTSSSVGEREDKEYTEYHAIINEVKQIPGWNERSLFHCFVLDLMNDDKKKKIYRTLSDDAMKVFWLQHEWTKAFNQPPPM